MKLSTDCSRTQDETIARLLAALAHPARLQLLRCIGERGACCVKELVWRVGLAQSTVSQHLKILVEAGLVRYRPERQSSRYSLDREALDTVEKAVGGIIHTICAGCCDGSRTQENPARDDAMPVSPGKEG